MHLEELFCLRGFIKAKDHPFINLCSWVFISLKTLSPHISICRTREFQWSWCFHPSWKASIMSSRYINSRHHWSVLTMEKSLSGLRMCKFWCQPHKAWVRSEFNKAGPIIVLCYISSDLNFRCVTTHEHQNIQHRHIK